MKTNVEKVLERDQKLSELDDRAGMKSLNKFILSLFRNLLKILYQSSLLKIHEESFKISN